jgi:hypothetical protein
MLERTALQALIDERDEWKLKAEKNADFIDKLQKRQHMKIRNDPDFARDAASRLNALERENRRLQSETKELRDKLKESEGENILLTHETNDKSNKLHGANKKAQKEKNVARKEKEKAKSALHGKNERLKAEKNWRKERNDAMGALEEQKKINAQLQEQLDIEKSGYSHLRENGTDSDYTTVVIPIEFRIHRGDYLRLKMTFDANRTKLTTQFRGWYERWRKPKNDNVKVVGADYMKAKGGKKIHDEGNMYNDICAFGEANGADNIPQTGAEHDDWRSQRGLRDFCRNVQANYNNSC